jgi:hypothetical protein
MRQAVAAIARVELADNLPNYSGHSGKFMLKLITAWIAKGFRSLKSPWRRQCIGASALPRKPSAGWFID